MVKCPSASDQISVRLQELMPLPEDAAVKCIFVCLPKASTSMPSMPLAALQEPLAAKMQC